MTLPEFSTPKTSIMRKMCAGDVQIFQKGKTRCMNTISAIFSIIGGHFQQKTLMLVDPKTCECKKVVSVTCIQPANPTKKRGRREKKRDPIS